MGGSACFAREVLPAAGARTRSQSPSAGMEEMHGGDAIGVGDAALSGLRSVFLFCRGLPANFSCACARGISVLVWSFVRVF